MHAEGRSDRSEQLCLTFGQPEHDAKLRVPANRHVRGGAFPAKGSYGTKLLTDVQKSFSCIQSVPDHALSIQEKMLTPAKQSRHPTPTDRNTT
jgi:hypothetical protein